MLTRLTAQLTPSFMTVGRTALALTAAALCAAQATAQTQGVFQDQGGIVAINFELCEEVDDWTLSTSTPGSTGSGYYRWDGPNFFNSPGASGVFGFDFQVDATATYWLAIRNRHENPDATEENDVWVRMDNGPWEKIFSNQAGSVGAWTWESRIDAGSQPQVTYPLSAGQHRIEFSGRSFGFKMDRFHIHLPGHPDANDETLPDSDRVFGTSYCTAANNSTGQPSSAFAIGSPIVSHNDVTIHCDALPNNVLGYFVTSRTEVFVPMLGGGNGNLCVGPNIGRYVGNVLSSGTVGSVSLPIDLTAIPQPNGAESVVAGESWRFQFWHRDTSGQGPTSNLSAGLRLDFE